MKENELVFEEFIESYLISEEGGWSKATDVGYTSDESRGMALDIVALTDFVRALSLWPGGAWSGSAP